MLVKTFNTSFLHIKNQCYLIYDNLNGILVDPSWNFPLINDFIREHKIIISAVLLTHSHYDHINLASKFSKILGIPVYISAKEINYFNFKCHNIQPIAHLEKINLPGFTVTCLDTPGHTIGSQIFLIDQHIFSGDTVFIEGVGFCDMSSGDVNSMYESVQFLKNYLAKTTLFWPGHSFGQLPGKSLAFLLQNNIYFQFDNREHFVKFRSRKKSRPFGIN